MLGARERGIEGGIESAIEGGIEGGKPARERGKKTESNVSRLRSSNRTDYTLARLRRDRVIR